MNKQKKITNFIALESPFLKNNINMEDFIKVFSILVGDYL